MFVSSSCLPAHYPCHFMHVFFLNMCTIAAYIWSSATRHTYLKFPWWRHQMETYSALLAICAGNSPVSGEFPAQRPVKRSFDVFFNRGLIKRLSKQSRGWWFEKSSCPLWRHCNAPAKRNRHAHRSEHKLPSSIFKHIIGSIWETVYGQCSLYHLVSRAGFICK